MEQKHNAHPKGVYREGGKTNIYIRMSRAATTNPYRLKKERLHPLMVEFSRERHWTLASEVG